MTNQSILVGCGQWCRFAAPTRPRSSTATANSVVRRCRWRLVWHLPNKCDLLVWQFCRLWLCLLLPLALALPFGRFAFWPLCLLAALPFGRFAFWPLCLLAALPFGRFAFWPLCLSLWLCLWLCHWLCLLLCLWLWLCLWLALPLPSSLPLALLL